MAQMPDRMKAPLEKNKAASETFSNPSTVSRHARISRTARVSERIICTSVSDIVIRWMSVPDAPYDLVRAISLLRFTIAEIAIRI